MISSNTLKDHLDQCERLARKEWEFFVARCVIGNMRDLAQKEGIVPLAFAIYSQTPENNPLRLLLREFGWDV